MNDADPGHARFLRCSELDGLTIQDNFTRVWTISARQDLHERALAGAVLAHKGVHLTGPDAKINALKDPYAREAFAYLAYFQDRPLVTWSSLCTG
jgi:hypothetical protein